MAATTSDELDPHVRRLVYERFAEESRPPSPAEIAHELGAPPSEVDASLRRLADQHVLVLAGGGTSIWMANPFSAVPTDFRVEIADRAWWGSCIWDSFGIVAMFGGTGIVRTWCHDCGDPLEVGVQDGELRGGEGVAHFAVPAARWWEDIGYT
ncbi:MAG TPA: organomercurial lyase [Actinomycetota bacterium]